MAFLASAITERVSKSEPQEKETAKFWWEGQLDSCLAHVLAGTSLPESFRPL